jgi:hypothetical protein
MKATKGGATLKRAIWAMTIALPVTWLVTGFADHAGLKLDSFLMYVIAPGFGIAIHLGSLLELFLGPPEHLLDGLGRIYLLVILFNWIYYCAICYGFILISAGPRPRSDSS